MENNSKFTRHFDIHKTDTSRFTSDLTLAKVGSIYWGKIAQGPIQMLPVWDNTLVLTCKKMSSSFGLLRPQTGVLICSGMGATNFVFKAPTDFSR